EPPAYVQTLRLYNNQIPAKHIRTTIIYFTRPLQKLKSQDLFACHGETDSIGPWPSPALVPIGNPHLSTAVNAPPSDLALLALCADEPCLATERLPRQRSRRAAQAETVKSASKQDANPL